MSNIGALPASNATKEAVISEYIKTAAGRQKLAASMIQPLRFRRDYTSVGRRAFLVEQLPDGALPIYDKDARAVAYVIGEEGESILAIQKPKRVIFPLFEIAANPVIPLTQVKERRFDLIERAQDLAKAEIQAEEDGRVFAIFDAVAGNAASSAQSFQSCSYVVWFCDDNLKYRFTSSPVEFISWRK